MKPWLSQTRWILVPKPPRERPSAWSGGSWSCASFRPPSLREAPDFFSRSCGSPTGADDGAVDAPQVVVNQALVIQFVQEPGDDTDPRAVPAPAVEAVVNGFPRPIAIREVAPGSAGVQDPKNAVDDGAIVGGRTTGLARVGPLRKQRLDSVPLLVREFVAAHGWPPAETTLRKL